MSSKLLQAFTLAAGLAIPLGALVATTSTAHAQGTDADKVAAKAAYKKGTIKYNLGEWQQAIVHFKAAFEAYPDASFLFNIAQSYRQAADCKQGAFFYKRYLAIKADASNKREVEGFIKELNAACKKLEESGNTTPPPPPPPPPPDTTPKDPDVDNTTGNTTDNTTNGSVGDGTEVAAAGPGQDPDPEGSLSATGGEVGDKFEDEGRPSLLLAYASLGSSFLTIGDLETDPMFNFTIGAGYPLHFGSLTVDGGLLISHTNVGWGAEPGATGNAGFTAVLANVGVGMEVANNIRLRGEVGVGAMVYSGLDVEGNIFVQDGMTATGALSSASFRFALGAEYAITDSLALSAQPIVFNFSPAPTGLKDNDIDNIRSLQLLVGVGYSM
jgi:hypothetical protein